MKKHRTIKISKILVIVLIVSFFAICFQLYRIAFFEVVDGKDLEAFAKNRNETKKILYASRGSIYDVNGEMLAQTVNSYTLIAYLSSSRTKDINNPQHVVDKPTTAHKLYEVFHKNGRDYLSEEDILNLLNTEGRYQVEFGKSGKDVSELLKSDIESLELPGIDFIQSNKRYYPKGTLAPYIVGYAKKDEEGKINGEMGVEQYFNDDLEGEDGYTKYETDIYGYRLPNSPETKILPIEGKDIYLTIDSQIQMFLENAVRELSEKNKMSWMTFTVADAKTGAILGSASNPTFDLNKLNITDYLNPLVSYQYEPGSTMKIYSFLASMENNNYDGSKTYKSGNIQIGDTTIYDFNNDGWGTITFDQGFMNSSNTAAVTLAMKLGKDKLSKFYDNCGFGQRTGIDLPNESTGNNTFIYDTELATASYGQGITTTPIQNIQALTLLANDGTIVKPQIISKIVDRTTGKVEYELERQELATVASKESVDKMRSLMSGVMTGITDAKFFVPKNIKMIGKTGTASIAAPTGGYLSGKYDYVRSFAGVFPEDNPRYVLYISAKQFVGNFKDVGKAVASVVEDIANYKNIAEVDPNVNANIITLENYINTDVIDTDEKLKNQGLITYILGDGKKVINVYPKSNNKVLKGSKVFILTSYNNILMPDVSLWSENEIRTFANFIGLKYQINGYGRVVSQSIAPNSIINLDETLVIELG